MHTMTTPDQAQTPTAAAPTGQPGMPGVYGQVQGAIGGGGGPTPPPAPARQPAPASPLDSINRIQQRRDDYQKTIDESGDNLDQKVKDRLQSQVALLDHKHEQAVLALPKDQQAKVLGHSDEDAKKKWLDRVKSEMSAAESLGAGTATVEALKIAGEWLIDHPESFKKADAEADKPTVKIPHISTIKGAENITDPITGITVGDVTGAINAVSDMVSGLTSTNNAQMMAGMGVLSKAAKLAGPASKAARAALAGVEGYFAKQMATGAGQKLGQFSVDVKNPQVSRSESTSELVGGGLDATMALGAGTGAAHNTVDLVRSLKSAPTPEDAVKAILENRKPPSPPETPPNNGVVTPPAPAARTIDQVNARLAELEQQHGPRDQIDPKTGRPTGQGERILHTEETELLKERDRLNTPAPAVPVDEDLAAEHAKLREQAAKAAAPAAPAAPEALDHKLAGYDTPEAFKKDYTEKAQHDVGETEEEFLKRTYCSQLGRGNFSIV